VYFVVVVIIIIIIIYSDTRKHARINTITFTLYELDYKATSDAKLTFVALQPNRGVLNGDRQPIYTYYNYQPIYLYTYQQSSYQHHSINLFAIFQETT